MTGSIIGCAFEMCFSGQDSSAETQLLTIAKSIPYGKIQKLQELPQNFGAPSPLYELSSEVKRGYKVGLGNGLLNITVVENYENWKEFYSQLEELYKAFFNANICTSIDRIGLKYVLFFEDDLFEKTETLNPKRYEKGEHYYFMSEKKIDNRFNCIKNMTNYGEHEGKFGSLYDLILFYGKTSSKNEFFSLVQEMYKCAKEEQSRMNINVCL